MIKKVGIHIYLIMAAIILMSASSGAFFAGINVLSSFVTARFEDRIAFLAKYLSLNAELGILIGDRKMLTGLAENLLTQQDVVKVTIINQRNETLADVSEQDLIKQKNPGELMKISAPVRIKETVDEYQTFSWQNNLTAGENIIGHVDVFYTVDGINAMLAEIKNIFYLLSAALVTLSLFLFVLISHYLVKPVGQLVTAARKVAQGDLALRVTPGNLPETRELAEAFNAMLDSLEESKRALEKASQEMVRQNTLAEMGKFSLMIAHEVKNPLGIIKSSLDILKQDHQLSSSDTIVGYMEDEIRRMNKLIEEFLEFARPATPNPRATDVNELLQECLTRVRLQQDLRGEFILHLPAEPCFLHVDPDLLTRVFSNIVKNGIEISNGAADIEVSTWADENWWFCSIQDSGPGIDPDDLPKIFEPFYTTRAKGSGLGLAFVSQVIKAHEGTITAGNREGGGASFTIRLPLALRAGEG